ncbi:MAG TPA: FAD-dependent oxidoreductase, partial [Thermoanaerobaculia bacterium]|nr:FAD-dependent oxidoreductase [Thermoanaerobaculia bacterium]
MRVSRRTFMAALASAPLLAHASSVRVVVVGAGAFGGWTALHLRNLGAQVTLVDAFGAGNSRSSSGGETRVIRAVYGADRIYVEMVKRSYELWETIASPAGEPLYIETGALWMHRGDDAYLRSSLPILNELGFPVDSLPIDEARRRWPQIDFRGVRSAWLERRAGALSARRCCAVVRDAFVKGGGAYRIAHAEPGPLRDGRMRAVRLGDGTTIEADAYVFACGPWLGRLFPDVIGDAIQP